MLNNKVITLLFMNRKAREENAKALLERIEQKAIKRVCKYFEEGAFEEYGITQLDLKDVRLFEIFALEDLVKPILNDFGTKKKLIESFLENPEITKQYGITQFNPEILSHYVKLQNVSEDKRWEYKTLSNILSDKNYGDSLGIRIEDSNVLSDYLTKILNKEV